jgi:ribosomal protein S18 acetylase RimI-like enzyme
MAVKIRKVNPEDFNRLEEILLENNMLAAQEIDGKEAMGEIYKRMGEYFLVAEIDESVVGMIRGCYDGSRALIHQMAVDKKYQRKGIGKQMVYGLASKFEVDGAKSISVTSTENSKEYYRGLSFSDLPITLMICFDIRHVLEKTKP